MQISVNSLIDYVLLNRGNKVFKGMSPEQVAAELLFYFTQGKGLYSINEETKQIDGIVVFVPHYRSRLLHIRYILVSSKSAFAKFITVATESFPKFTIVARRRNKEIIYKDTNRLLCKLLKST